jgi:RNA recognition motif-containing protein
LSIRNPKSSLPTVFLRSQARFETSFAVPDSGKTQYLIIMSTKLYVGNLSFSTSNQDLEDMFGKVGTVLSSNIIEDRETGRSRGFAFVEMSSREEAQNAISSLNGTEVDGRQLLVNEAKPRENSGGGGRGGYGGGGGRGGNRGGGGGYGGGGSRW